MLVLDVGTFSSDDYYILKKFKNLIWIAWCVKAL